MIKLSFSLSIIILCVAALPVRSPKDNAHHGNNKIMVRTSQLVPRPKPSANIQRPPYVAPQIDRTNLAIYFNPTNIPTSKVQPTIYAVFWSTNKGGPFTNLLGIIHAGDTNQFHTTPIMKSRQQVYFHLENW